MSPRHSSTAPRGGRRLGALAIVPLSLLLTATALAAGPSGALPDPAGDATDPGPGAVADYDIVSVAQGRAHGGILRHVVRVAGTARLGDPHTPGSGARVEVDTARGRPGDCNGNSRDPRGRTEYIVTPESDGAIIDCTGPGIPTMRPAATVRTRGDRLVFSFPARAIGDPAAYRWFATTGTGATTADVAPAVGATNVPRYVTQRPRNGHGGGWRRCGDLQRVGAGANNIRARNLGCRPARRVARRYKQSGGATQIGAWRCAFRRSGYEVGRVRCAVPGDARRRLVTFEFGA